MKVLREVAIGKICPSVRVTVVAALGLLAGITAVSAQKTLPPMGLLNLGAPDAEQNLDADKGFETQLLRKDGETVLQVSSKLAGDTQGVRLKAPKGAWDLTSYLYAAMDVRNTGEGDVLVTCRLDGARWVDGGVSVPPGQSRILSVLLKRKTPPPYFPTYFPGMNGMPGGFVGIWENPDLARITMLFVALPEASGSKAIEISNLRAFGAYDPPSEQRLKGSFLPFVDRFGQYRYAEYTGRMHAVEDLARQRQGEAEELASKPGPPDWDRYGGWAGGPQLKATGYFRTEKHAGKWWLVDPDGRLFWSHGTTCVRSGNGTPITGRERSFAELPPSDSPAAGFYGTGGRAAHGYYQEHFPYRTFAFDRADLLLKYGTEWSRTFADTAHKRLRSWGMNTIANWSDEEIYLQRNTPYTATIHTGGRRIEGSQGNWGKFPDPFDPGFREALRKSLAAEKGKSAGDPWCIGYFVDNELTWGDEAALASAALASPPDQPAKKALVEGLRAKYAVIARLNSAWGTAYASWKALLDSHAIPPGKAAREELVQFNHRLAEAYFRICREAVKEGAPNNLYLGCRFDFHFYPEEQPGDDWLVRIAGRFCDVISFNRYRFSARDLVPPKDVDKPVMIGEFHFGALDRGMLHTGLRSVLDQSQRGEIYASYVRGALANPFMVGTHWFQYGDQPLTGRSDGENYQIGLIDVCDRPYAETIEACRSVGYKMYEYRMAAK
jgi:hypothetical protein